MTGALAGERFTGQWTTIGVVALAGIPGIALRIADPHIDPLLGAAIYGLSILAAALLLSWAAETAEMDISQGLALAIIAVIAVLPEYAVDAFLAWEAGTDPVEAEKGLAIANMTGGNRLLIGIGWPLLFFIFFYRKRLKEMAASFFSAKRIKEMATRSPKRIKEMATQSPRRIKEMATRLKGMLVSRVRAIEASEAPDIPGRIGTELVVSRARSVELLFLAVATIYVILVPLRSTLTLADTIVLVALFVVYLVMTSRSESEHVELVGPARAMGALPDWPRRVVVVLALAYAAAVIIASAEPFAHGLVDTGKKLNISEFFLIQWVAPLASESPEVLVAALLAWRGRAAAGMGILISSKVNQWTLLIGTLPIAFLIGSGDWGIVNGLPLDGRQKGEIFLTAAQSAFALAVFINLRMNRIEAWGLLLLFMTQLFLNEDLLGKDAAHTVRLWYGVGYMVLCAVILVLNHTSIPGLLRDARDTITGKADFGDEQTS